MVGRILKASAVVGAVAFSLAAEAVVNTWYVDDAKGRDDGTYDGTRAETPFKTIGHAFTRLSTSRTSNTDGDLVRVADGTYYISETLIPTESVRLESVSGDPKKCIVDAQGLCPCFRTAPDAGVNATYSYTFRICGITFRNGFSDKYDVWGSRLSYSAAGLGLCACSMVSNCIVENCHRDVSATITSSDAIVIAGGGIGYHGSDSPYWGRKRLGMVLSKPWADVMPGIYDSVVSNCSLYVHATHTASTTSAQGGGICCRYTVVSNVVVTHCAVSNACANVGDYGCGGGGIWAHDGTRIVDSVLRKNAVRGISGTSGWANGGHFNAGGGICMAVQSRDARFTEADDVDVIRDCLVEDNEVVGNMGGGIVSCGGRVVRCTIRNNSLANTRNLTAYLGGSGIKLFDAQTSVVGCWIEGNRGLNTYGYESGGPLELMGTTDAVIRDTVVTNNTSGFYGGLSLTYNTAGTLVSNVVVAGNTARGKHCCLNASQLLKSLLVTDSLFIDNRSHTASTAMGASGEGVVYLNADDAAYAGVTVRNSLFLGNEVSCEKGYLFSAGVKSGTPDFRPLTLENCTFADNVNRLGTAGTSAHYVHVTSIDSVQTIGCVFADNVNDQVAAGTAGRLGGIWSQWIDRNAITNCYADFESSGNSRSIPVTAENGNLNGSRLEKTPLDPKFADAAHGDYRLTKDSPLVDAGGAFRDWMGTGARNSALDMGDAGYRTASDGKYGVKVSFTRRKPRRSGAAVDMGCFEFRPRAGAAILVR